MEYSEAMRDPWHYDQTRASFAKWHYKNDLTHTWFFSEATFQWLARQWRAELTIVGG